MTPLEQWAGGAVHLVSASFAGTNRPPLVISGADTLTTAREDDSTMVVTLPRWPSSERRLDLRYAGHNIDLGTVTVRGFRSQRALADLRNVLVSFQKFGTPVVIGEGQPVQFARRLAMVDLPTGWMTHRTGLVGIEHYGPGVSFRPLELTLFDYASHALGVYTLDDIGPTYLGPTRVTGGRHVAQLSDSVWLTTGSIWSTTHAFNGSSVTVRDFFFDTPWAIIIAPQARRATFTYNGSRHGAPVLNTETGHSAYWIPGFHRVSAAAFSSDENRLYLVGDHDVPESDTLVAVNSADGLRLGAAAIPGGFSPLALATDPAAPYLYLSGNRPDFTSGRVDKVAVLVFDAATLALIGDLDPGASASACAFIGWEGAISVDRNRSTLHVVWVGSPAACQWSFDLVGP